MRHDLLFIDGQTFRLADDVDISELRRDLQDALIEGNVAIVRVVMDEANGPVDLLVNGNRVRTASVYRTKPASTLGFG